MVAEKARPGSNATIFLPFVLLLFLTVASGTASWAGSLRFSVALAVLAAGVHVVISDADCVWFARDRTTRPARPRPSRVQLNLRAPRRDSNT